MVAASSELTVSRQGFFNGTEYYFYFNSYHVNAISPRRSLDYKT